MIRSTKTAVFRNQQLLQLVYPFHLHKSQVPAPESTSFTTPPLVLEFSLTWLDQNPLLAGDIRVHLT